MDERPSDTDVPEYAEPPIEPEATVGDDALAGVQPPDYAEPTLDELPVDLEQPDDTRLPLDEPPVDLEPPDDAGLPLDEPLVDLEPSDYVEYSFGAEPPASLEQIDYGDLPVEAGAPTVDLAQAETELLDDTEPLGEDAMAAVDGEPAGVKPLAYAEPPPDAEVPDYATAMLIDEGPGGAALYEAFVPQRMRRDRVAAMTYPSAIEMVNRWRKKGDPAELGDLDMSDEEIAADIQDYARGIDTQEERANWLLGQILEEQQRQTRHLRGVKTVLILLIAALALAAIASCVLTFVQLPNLVP